jgi:hypothetical protein
MPYVFPSPNQNKQFAFEGQRLKVREQGAENILKKEERREKLKKKTRNKVLHNW